MRIAIVVMLLLALPTVAAQSTLYVAGDGRDVLVTDPDDPDGAWMMSTEGPGEQDTVFRVHGSWDYTFYPAGNIPTWIYDGSEGAVTLSGATPLTLYAYVDHALGGLCANVNAQLFDADGNTIGPAQAPFAQDPAPPPSVDELVWEFEGLAGTFPGLAVQVAPFGMDCGHADFYFGSSDHPARLELGAGDHIGAPPAPAGGAPKTVEATLTGPSADVTLSFPAEPSNTTFVYYWENQHDALHAVYEAIVEQGTIAVVVSGPDGEVLNESHDRDAASEKTWEEAPPGRWVIKVMLDGFVGRLDLGIAEADVAATPTTNETQDVPTTEPDTGTPAENEAPGAGLPVVAFLVASALVVLRRRLR